MRFQCGFCNAEVGSKEGYCTDANMRLMLCPVCNRLTLFEAKTQIPGVMFGAPVMNVPPMVEHLYNEARTCSSAGAHTAAVLACRKLLMHIAVEQKAEPEQSFMQYVEYLAANGYVPPNGRGWVDHIRKKGNEANHDIVLMTPADSRDLIGCS